MRILLAAAAIFLSFSPSNAADDNHLDSIVGKYQVCSISCWTIELRRDLTFSYTLSGDVFGKHTVIGSFKVVAPNLVVARSDEQPSEFPLGQKAEAQQHTLSVIVRDPEGLLPNAVVELRCAESRHTLLTDHEGRAAAPYCAPSSLEVSFPGMQTVRYESFLAGTTLFEVTLDPVTRWVTDELWLIHDDTLHRIDEPGLKKVR